jgi:hypothetical protein
VARRREPPFLVLVGGRPGVFADDPLGNHGGFGEVDVFSERHRKLLYIFINGDSTRKRPYVQAKDPFVRQVAGQVGWVLWSLAVNGGVL